MHTHTVGLSIAAAALFATSGFASAQPRVPVAPESYVYCEEEYNDDCDKPTRIVYPILQDSDWSFDELPCIHISGKLQEDCVWDIEPKCAIVVFGKPEPARDSRGNPIPGQFCEPILHVSYTGELYGVPIIDGAVRVAVTALADAFDGTVNGLNNNGPHNERGTFRLEVRYNYGYDMGIPRGDDEPDQTYTFPSPKNMGNGADALRASILVPTFDNALQGDERAIYIESVDLICRDDVGAVPVGYDIDFYRVEGLLPLQPYCIEVIGGLDMNCEKTDTVLAVYDKNCFQIAFDDDGGQGVYSQVCTYAEIDGTITFAVSGKGDENFNGLLDATEQDYFDFLHILQVRHGLGYTFVPGASTKDYSEYDVIRYPRAIWDDARYAAFFSPGNPPESRYDHGVIGGYCIRLCPANHVSGGGGGGQSMSADRADINGDGFVNAQDLALLLSFWGTVNN